jgi:hypothetical protein
MNAVSGAGHDAVYMAKLVPAGMIFIPCKDGISHNEIEDAKPEHITADATCCCTPCWSARGWRRDSDYFGSRDIRRKR